MGPPQLGPSPPKGPVPIWSPHAPLHLCTGNCVLLPPSAQGRSSTPHLLVPRTFLLLYSILFSGEPTPTMALQTAPPFNFPQVTHLAPMGDPTDSPKSSPAASPISAHLSHDPSVGHLCLQLSPERMEDSRISGADLGTLKSSSKTPKRVER